MILTTDGGAVSLGNDRANWDKLGLENLRYLLVVLVCGI